MLCHRLIILPTAFLIFHPTAAGTFLIPANFIIFVAAPLKLNFILGNSNPASNTIVILLFPLSCGTSSVCKYLL